MESTPNNSKYSKYSNILVLYSIYSSTLPYLTLLVNSLTSPPSHLYSTSTLPSLQSKNPPTSFCLSSIHIQYIYPHPRSIHYPNSSISLTQYLKLPWLPGPVTMQARQPLPNQSIRL